MIGSAKISLAKRLSLNNVAPLIPNKICFYGHIIGEPNSHPAWQKYRYPSFEEFDIFVKHIRGIGYEFVTLDEYTRHTDRKICLMTFDDGFQQLASGAGLFLKSLNIPFAAFIHPPSTLPPDFPNICNIDKSDFLNIAQINSLKKLGCHVGFHGNTHTKLETIKSADDIKKHIEPALDMSLILSSPRAYAYPYLAPTFYQPYDKIILQNGFEVIFDTRGFGENGPHYFRVPLDIGHEFSNVTNCCEFSLILHALSRKVRHSK